VFFTLSDRIRAQLAANIPRGRFSPVSIATGCFLVLLIASANPFVLKIYRLAPDPFNPSHFSRLGQQGEPDYRYTDLFTLAHAAPDDVVIARMPHVLDFYAMRPRATYAINTGLTSRMYYDGGRGTPFYGDKHLGLYSIYSLEQLKDVVSRSRRVWLILPGEGVTRFDSPDVLNYLKTNGQVMAEGNAQRVVLLRGAGSSTR
jgi:hypothetical protein